MVAPSPLAPEAPGPGGLGGRSPPRKAGGSGGREPPRKSMLPTCVGDRFQHPEHRRTTGGRSTIWNPSMVYPSQTLRRATGSATAPPAPNIWPLATWRTLFSNAPRVCGPQELKTCRGALAGLGPRTFTHHRQRYNTGPPSNQCDPCRRAVKTGRLPNSRWGAGVALIRWGNYP